MEAEIPALATFVILMRLQSETNEAVYVFVSFVAKFVARTFGLAVPWEFRQKINLTDRIGMHAHLHTKTFRRSHAHTHNFS